MNPILPTKNESPTEEYSPITNTKPVNKQTISILKLAQDLIREHKYNACIYNDLNTIRRNTSRQWTIVRILSCIKNCWYGLGLHSTYALTLKFLDAFPKRKTEVEKPQELAPILLKTRAQELLTSPAASLTNSHSQLSIEAPNISYEEFQHIYGETDPSKTQQIHSSLQLMEKMRIAYKNTHSFSPKMEEFFSTISQAISTEIPEKEFCKTYVNRLKELDEKKSLLITGDWKIFSSENEYTANPLYYVFTKNSSNLFSLQIFNSGTGSENHSQIRENGITKFLPFINFENIEKEKLFNPEFMKKLWLVMNQSSSNINLHKKNAQLTVYEGLLANLEKELHEPEIQVIMNESIAHGLQRENSWMELISYMNTICNKDGNTKKESKAFQYFIELQSLIGFYQKNKDNLANQNDKQNFFLKATKTFAHNCLQSFQEGIISEEEFTKGVATVQDIQDRFAANHRQEFLKKYSLTADLNIASLVSEPQESQLYPNNLKKLDIGAVFSDSKMGRSVKEKTDSSSCLGIDIFTPLSIRFKGKEEEEAVPASSLKKILGTFEWDFSQPITAENCKTILSDFLHVCQAYSGQNPYVTSMYMDRLFEKLPVPEVSGETMWHHIPKEDIAECMKQITLLTELRIELATRHGNTMTQSMGDQATFDSFKSLAIQHFLLTKSEVIKNFNTYMIDITMYEQKFKMTLLNRLEDCCYLSSVESDIEVSKLFNYFSAYKRKRYEDDTITFYQGLPSVQRGAKWNTLIENVFSQCTGVNVNENDLEKKKKHVLEDVFGLSAPLPFVFWYRTSLLCSHWVEKGPALSQINEKILPIQIVYENSKPQRKRGEFSVREGFRLDNEISVKKIDDALNRACIVRNELQHADNENYIRHSGLSLPLQDVVSELVQSIFTLETTDLRIIKLISFFSTHRDLLSESSFQKFFLKIFFLHNSVRSLFKKAKRFEPIFKEFLYRGIEDAKEKNDIKTLCFYHQIASYGLDAMQHGQVDSTSVRSVVPSKKSLLEFCTTNSQRSLVYREIGISIVRKKGPLCESDIKDLIESRIFLSIYPNEAQFKSDLDIEFENAIQIFMPEIKKYIQENQETIQEILKKFHCFTEELRDQKCDSTHFPQCILGKIIIDFVEGSVASENTFITALPSHISQNPIFSLLFPPETVLTATASEGKTIFTFDQGNARVSFDHQGPIFQKKIKGTWYEYVSPCPVNLGVQLPQATFFWLSTDKKNALFINDEKKPIYEISFTEKGMVESIKDLNTQLFLINISEKKSPYAFLQAIEEKAFTHVWADKKGVPQSIDLPRYNVKIHFSKTNTGVKAVLNYPKGFFIAERQRFPGMDTFPHFLLIENEEGVKKLLIPKKSIAASQIHPSKLLIYDIDEEFQPVSSNRENNLYLAYLAIVNKDYHKSLQLLRKYGNDVKKYSFEESEIFVLIKTAFEESKDQNPQACAVQLCALANIIKHIRLFGGELCGFENVTELESYAARLFDRYFSGSTESSQLTHEEEKEILLAFQKNKATWIQERKQIIEGKKINPVVVSQRIPSYSAKKQEESPPERIIDGIKQKDSLDINSPPVVLLPQKGTSLKNPYAKFFTTEVVSEPEKKNKDSLLQALSPPGDIQKRRFRELKDDIEIASRPVQKDVFVQVKESNLSQLETRLNIECAEENKRLYVVEAELLHLANQQTQQISTLQKIMKVLSTEKIPVVMNDLHVFFIQQDAACLLRKNPSLSPTTISKINQKLLDYFLLKSQYQKNQKGKEILEKIKSTQEPGEKKELISLLGTLLTPEQAYIAHEHPEFLVFECQANITLRKDQVQSLDNFLKKNALEEIDQILMGAGKTKILLPILALKKADGNALSIVVVPDPLVETNARTMQISAGQNFHQMVTHVHIDSNSDFSAQNMKALYEDIEAIRLKKECLIMTDKTLATIQLYFETEIIKCKEQTEGDIPENLEWIRKILFLFKEKGNVIIDEADVILNNRRIVNFTHGKNKPLPQAFLDCTEKLFVSALASFDEQSQEIFLTDKQYSEKKEQIALSFLSSMKNQLGHISNIVSDQDLMLYLLGEETIEIQKRIESIQDTATKDLLGLMKGECTTILALTIGKQFSTAYGFSKESTKPIAIPYSSSNSPVEGSDFGTIYEIINYTILSYLNVKNLPINIVKEAILKIQNQLKEDSSLDSSVPFQKLPSYQKLKQLMGDQEFRPFDQDLYVNIIENLKKDRKQLISFVKTFILSTIITQSKMVSCAAPDLISMFHHVQGFTGTPWNEETMPKRLQVNRACGTDGKTIHILWEKSRDNVNILKGTDFETNFQEIISLIEKDTNSRAFIDVGAFFRGKNNKDIASLFLEKLPQVGGIIFFDEDKEVILERNRKTPIPLEESVLPLEEKFTYYDQRHTTGADIAQIDIATAIVSVGRDMLLRDFLQAVWRMRGLDKKQKISFVVPPLAAESIREALHLEPDSSFNLGPILQYHSLVQFDQLDKHCLLALSQKVDSILKNEALSPLIQEPLSLKKLNEASSSLNLLEIPVKNHPYLVFGGQKILLSKEDFLTKKLREKQRDVQNGWANVTDQKRIIENIDQLLASCTIQETDISTSSFTEGTQVEIQQEMQVCLQLELEENSSSTFKIEYTMQWTPDLKKDPNQFISADFFANKQSLSNMLKVAFGSDIPVVFDENLLLSTNCLYQQKENQKDSFFSPFRPPIKTLLVTQKPGEDPKVLMVMSYEAQFCFDELSSKNSDQTVFIYDINLGVFQESKDTQATTHIEESEQFQRIKAQVKFFNGEISYSSQELKSLKAWFKNADKNKIKTFFLDECLKQKPNQKALFSTSPLASIL